MKQPITVVRDDRFANGIDAYWGQYLVGDGQLSLGSDGLRLSISDASAQSYSDAQIDDYRGIRRAAMPWRPPLTLELRARFSHDVDGLRGTAGFGFWNHPVLLPGNPLPAPPRAIWFFYASPPSNMKLDTLTPGWGWKAATIDASRPAFFALAPTAPLAFPLMRVPLLNRALWPIAQVALGVRETPLTVNMRSWHHYKLHWEAQRARFWLDDLLVLDSPLAPRGPLGLVIWIDNQYAIVTPHGQFGGGLLDIPGEQWLEVESLRITTYTKFG